MPFSTIRASAQHGTQGSSSSKAASSSQKQRSAAAYTVAQPKRVDGVRQQQSKPSQVPAHVEPAIQPVQHLDDPALWPEQAVDTIQPSLQRPLLTTPQQRVNSSSNPLRLPAAARSQQPPPSLTAAGGRQSPPLANKHPSLPAAAVHGAGGAGVPPHHQQKAHRHPPVAPEDPNELLQVLQVMDPPRRRLVIFKGGGYVYADMEALIQSAGLGHVLRLTNLIRKAHCIVAKERRDTGKRVNLAEHLAAARNANIPFLLIDRLEPEQLVALVRPLLVRKRIVVEHPQRRRRHRSKQEQGSSSSDGNL